MVLTSERKQHLAETVASLPSFPSSVRQILSLCDDPRCPEKDIIEVLRSDAALSLKMIRLFNSPLHDLPQEVSSIHHAWIYLGLKTLRNDACGLAAIEVLSSVNEGCLNMGEFWLHSLAVGTATRMLGTMLGVAGGESADYFIAGLLHDLGRVLLSQAFPQEFQEITERVASEGGCLHDAEFESFGVTHMEAGLMLAEKWRLPKELYEVIEWHHSPEVGPSSQLVDCVFAADQLCKKLAFGSSGDYCIVPFPPSVEDRFSLSLEGLARELGTLDVKVEENRLFIQLGNAF